MTSGPPWSATNSATIGPTLSGAGGDDLWSYRIDPASSFGRVAEHSDDQRIVAAVLDGDRDAYRVLVDRESAGLVRAAYRILGDLAEAEDVAQEAFVTAYRSLHTWRAEGPFGAWLSRIGVRLALRQVAKRRTVAWARPRDDQEGLLAQPAGAVGDPESLALRGERQRLVRDAVARLVEPYREVVALRFFAERSLDEIASITGRPLGTVKTHLHRDLLRLRAEADEGGPS